MRVDTFWAKTQALIQSNPGHIPLIPNYMARVEPRNSKSLDLSSYTAVLLYVSKNGKCGVIVSNSFLFLFHWLITNNNFFLKVVNNEISDDSDKKDSKDDTNNNDDDKTENESEAATKPPTPPKKKKPLEIPPEKRCRGTCVTGKTRF